MCNRADLSSGLARRHPDELQRDVELEKCGISGSDLTERSSQIEERSPTATAEAKGNKKDKKGGDKKGKKDKRKNYEKCTQAGRGQLVNSSTKAVW
jgi:hypothetical protein